MPSCPPLKVHPELAWGVISSAGRHAFPSGPSMTQPSLSNSEFVKRSSSLVYLCKYSVSRVDGAQMARGPLVGSCVYSVDRCARGGVEVLDRLGTFELPGFLRR